MLKTPVLNSRRKRGTPPTTTRPSSQSSATREPPSSAPPAQLNRPNVASVCLLAKARPRVHRLAASRAPLAHEAGRLRFGSANSNVNTAARRRRRYLLSMLFCFRSCEVAAGSKRLQILRTRNSRNNDQRFLANSEMGFICI